MSKNENANNNGPEPENIARGLVLLPENLRAWKKDWEHDLQHLDFKYVPPDVYNATIRDIQCELDEEEQEDWDPAEPMKFFIDWHLHEPGVTVNIRYDWHRPVEFCSLFECLYHALGEELMNPQGFDLQSLVGREMRVMLFYIAFFWQDEHGNPHAIPRIIPVSRNVG